MKMQATRLPWAASIFVALALLAGTLLSCGDTESRPEEREAQESRAEATQTVNVALQQEDTRTSTAPPQATFSAPTTVLATEQPSANGVIPTAVPATLPAPADSSQTRTDSDDVSPSLMLAAFEEVLNGIYESVVPSVVYIRVPRARASSLMGVPGIPDDLLWSAGSGFVWDEQGHIVTNHHVVEDAIGQVNQVRVEFSDSTQAKGTVVGSDPDSDLAVIKIEDGDWNLHPAALGDSSEVMVGQLAVAIGAPFGQEFTMTSGIVSAVGRNISSQGQFTIPEVIQTDSAINPGNSGGPLLDRSGQVIGINTQIISRTGSFSGVGMAVPVDIAKRVVPPLIAEGEFNYPWLGVSIATVDTYYAEGMGLPKETRGALIISTVNGSPADRAGLRGSEFTVEIDGTEYPSGGDIIVSIGPHQISSSNDLIAHLTYHNSPGDTISMVVLRDGQRQELEVTLGQRPERP